MGKQKRANGYKLKSHTSVCKVGGFLEQDDYVTTLRKALVPILGSKKVELTECSLVIGNGCVKNLPLQDGKPWSLGGCLKEMGGCKRAVIGVYIPSDIEVSQYKSDRTYTTQICHLCRIQMKKILPVQVYMLLYVAI